jgi:hypothetical protein
MCNGCMFAVIGDLDVTDDETLAIFEHACARDQPTGQRASQKVDGCVGGDCEWHAANDGQDHPVHGEVGEPEQHRPCHRSSRAEIGRPRGDAQDDQPTLESDNVDRARGRRRHSAGQHFAEFLDGDLAAHWTAQPGGTAAVGFMQNEQPGDAVHAMTTSPMLAHVPAGLSYAGWISFGSLVPAGTQPLIVGLASKKVVPGQVGIPGGMQPGVPVDGIEKS